MIDVGSIVRFHDFAGRAHDARVLVVHTQDLVDLQLTEHATAPLRRIARADAPNPFRWTEVTP